MSADSLPVILYMLNFALIFTHEIDSAYWQEWRLFHLPGGIQLFLVLHVCLLLVALYGLTALLQNTGIGHAIALILVAAGIFAAGIHTYFIRVGHPEFTLPVSRALLALMFGVSLLQGYAEARALGWV